MEEYDVGVACFFFLSRTHLRFLGIFANMLFIPLFFPFIGLKLQVISEFIISGALHVR